MATTTTTTAAHDFECALGSLYIALDQVADPVERLDYLRRALAGVTGDVERTVAAARRDGATWQQVADALHLNSKQTAQARYGR